jgi:hypothetical protein
MTQQSRRPETVVMESGVTRSPRTPARILMIIKKVEEDQVEVEGWVELEGVMDK